MRKYNATDFLTLPAGVIFHPCNRASFRSSLRGTYVKGKVNDDGTCEVISVTPWLFMEPDRYAWVKAMLPYAQLEGAARLTLSAHDVFYVWTDNEVQEVIQHYQEQALNQVVLHRPRHVGRRWDWFSRMFVRQTTR